MLLEGKDVAYDDGHLAVSGHEWGCCQSKNENVGEHFELVLRSNFKKEIECCQNEECIYPNKASLRDTAVSVNEEGDVVN